ncbi:Methylesterase 18 [Gracilariopsis chorda]|uniref:Methylesterase 18 n=1 Tax=Gracilariopsis chorda TaxID=448386 RepID=A0A2V3IZQ6_9FLOR|nr:Methylesterase 18 [Gracilariopsis chorda]|eukprot:PXF47533.1 Methylesterase 18 [Gracilariopsis chorda]
MEVIDVPPTVDTTTAPPEPHLILFVHGSLHGAWCFKYFQSYFADRGYLTKAISLRGCGESQIDQTTSTTIDQHIGDLNDAIPKLVGSTPPILVGHSNGCFYIQKWLEQNTTVPVPSTVFLTPIPPSGVSKMVMRTMKKQGLWNALRIALGIMRKAMTKEVLFCRRLLFSKKDAEGFSEQLEGDQKLQEYMHLMGKTKLTLDGRSFKKTVQSTGTFTGKAIVLGGTNDVLVDQEGLEETAQMWNADLHIFDDAPHELMLYSKWEDVAELILKWLQEQNPMLESGTNQQPNSI